MDTINFEKFRELEDGYIDYNIIFNGENVGLIQTIELEERDYIFIRQIHIEKDFRNKGIARKVVSYFIENHDKAFRFCIATNSESAIHFWNSYLGKTSYNKNNLRGDIWEIRK